MKIGLVTDFYYPWIGGPSAVVKNLGDGLSARGHLVSLLAPSPDGRSQSELDGKVAVTRVHSIPVPFGYDLRSSALPLRAVSEWLDASRPDVIHVHHPFPLSAAALLLARTRGIPVVATNHTIPECSLWGIRRFELLYLVARRAFADWLVYLLRRADRLATPTRTASNALQALGLDRPVSVISNGIDCSRFRPGPDGGGWRSRLGLDDRPVVLYTGRLDAEKQMDVWLRAATVACRTADCQLVVGGQGSDRGRIERLAEGLGIANRTRFIGYVSIDELPDLYRMADVYFITSPVELQSICTLEAMASGLPVVAVQAGALPELVEDGASGHLAPPGSWQQLGASLAELVSDQETRHAMGARGREIALQHDLQHSIDRYELLLQDSVVGAPVGERSAAGR